MKQRRGTRPRRKEIVHSIEMRKQLSYQFADHSFQFWLVSQISGGGVGGLRGEGIFKLVGTPRTLNFLPATWGVVTRDRKEPEAGSFRFGSGG